MISIEKTGSLLTITNDKIVCKYDLKDNQCYSPSGNRVKSLNKWFSHKSAYQIIQEIKEEPYRKWFSKVYSNNYYTNFGSVLGAMKYWMPAEKMYSAGITEFDDDYVTFNKISKGLIKFCRDNNVTLDEESAEALQTFGKEVCMDIINSTAYESAEFTVFLALKDKCKPRDIITYFNKLSFQEGIEVDWQFTTEFTDYIEQASQLRDNYVKYPKNFWTTKYIVDRQFRELKKEFDGEKFRKIAKENIKLNKTIGEYQYTYPSCGEEIRNEAVQQAHCVAQYIDKVTAGTCHILFMRDKKEPEKSLITFELDEDYNLRQYCGKFNRDLTEVELENLQKYVKRLK